MRGRVDVLGRRFDVQKDSQVRFTGPPLAPYLNITAEHVNEREHVTVFVHIRGQGKDFTIKPTSDPPMSETEIYTLLATGRRTLERELGRVDDERAGRVGGGLARGLAGAEGAGGEAAAGRVLHRGGRQGWSAPSSRWASTSRTRSTWATPAASASSTTSDTRTGRTPTRCDSSTSSARSWSLEANYGDARSGGLDLIWSKDY